MNDMNILICFKQKQVKKHTSAIRQNALVLKKSSSKKL